LSFADAVAIALESLESGNALKKFQKFIQLNA